MIPTLPDVVIDAIGEGWVGCPLRAAAGEVRVLQRLVEHMDLLEVGVMPAEGGWEDQSAWWCDAMRQLLAMRTALRGRKDGD